MRDLTAAEYARAKRERLLNNPEWVAARFRGSCGVCGTRFEQDTAIRHDPHHVWRAECCADTDEGNDHASETPHSHEGSVTAGPATHDDIPDF